MPQRLLSAALVLLASALSAPQAAAHPHMFVEARAELLLDDAGRLVGVRSVMIIDELTTLFTLEGYGILTLDEPLTEAQRAEIGAGMVDGLAAYDYFTDLQLGDERQSFVDAAVTELRLEEARLAATLELTLETPKALSAAGVELALYDPTYFAAVDTIAEPTFSSARTDCRVRLVKFEPSSMDAANLFMLGALSREETPENVHIGARFADRSFVTCSG